MCVSVFVSVPVSVGLRVGGCVSVRPPMGRGICKVSSLFSCRADMQPTDMHSPQLRPQPRLLQPLPPHTVTGRYRRQSEHCTVPRRLPSLLPSLPKGHLARGCPQTLVFLRPSPRGLCHARRRWHWLFHLRLSFAWLWCQSPSLSCPAPFFSILEKYFRIFQSTAFRSRNRKIFFHSASFLITFQDQVTQNISTVNPWFFFF